MKMLFPAAQKGKRKRGRHKKRRQSSWHHFREWLWPSMGWYNLLRLYELRLKREQDTSASIAKGLAIGVFVSFTPFIGTHLPQMALYCFVLRGNLVAAIIGSLVGNPWTFPLFFIWEYNLGHLILGNLHLRAEEPLSLTLEGILQNPGAMWDKYLWPMTVGGVPTGLLLGFVTFYVVLIHIKSYKRARAAYLARRKEHNQKIWQARKEAFKGILNPFVREKDE